MPNSLDVLPGGVLVAQGMTDLRAGLETIEALVVSIGYPRLTALGLTLPTPIDGPEHLLYEMLAAGESDAAHSRYNALVRELVSFERALACAV